MRDLLARMKTEVVHLSAQNLTDNVTRDDVKDVITILSSAINEVEFLRLQNATLLDTLESHSNNAARIVESHRHEKFLRYGTIT